jgi:hypothetical protein
MTMNHIRGTMAAMLLTLASTAAASPSSIGVFFDAGATDCDATIPYASIFEVYVVALPGTDAASGGITGAEFRLDGIDPGWFPQVTPSPLASMAVGNLFASANIAFESCQGPGPVLLYTVWCIMGTQPAPRVLRIERANIPAGPILAPMLVLCDAPVFTKIWVSGGQAFLNGGTCTVGVEANTWSAVKSMFR